MTANHTFRVVDGERVPGTWRHVFIRNGATYHLSDLKIFADGAIDCWEWVDLDGLRDRLESGWVATGLEPGARASAFQVGSWRFADPLTHITAEELLGEVADEIERLNDRPDSGDRCLQALDRYLESRTEDDRLALRAAYLAIPGHQRLFTLGDMDAKDRPLTVLCTNLGEPLLTDSSHIVDAESRRHAFDYFAERAEDIATAAAQRHADDPETPSAGFVHLYRTVFPKGYPEDPGEHVLRNEFPAPIEIASTAYPTVTHAYWALSTTDQAVRERIRQAENAFTVSALAEDAPRTPHWPDIRTAVMARLLRAKFAQHPGAADFLVATGDVRIHYSGTGSDHWCTHGAQGRNWMGRLLELVRSEILADRHFC